ncbi:hypothetical protein H4R19_000880 [Coemansia spiralis]|nr:hypothetical protein H4R19_000880 [Coemansia spiralis]
MDGLPAVNRLLENARGSESLALVLADNQLPAAPDTITCTALTELHVAAQTYLETVLELIERMPRLAKLSFGCLDLGTVIGDISIPSAEDAAVEPLNTSLKELTLSTCWGADSSDETVDAVKFILLKIPSLVKLCATQIPVDPVYDFVEEYAPRYPHLSGIELELNGGEDSVDT